LFFSEIINNFAAQEKKNRLSSMTALAVAAG
jgi:hypothetical protein